MLCPWLYICRNIGDHSSAHRLSYRAPREAAVAVSLPGMGLSKFFPTVYNWTNCCMWSVDQPQGSLTWGYRISVVK
jgi:hypothetical protein